MSTAGASHSQSSECQLQKLIPCYFALTSEPNPPLERELCPQQESGANSKQENATLMEIAGLPHLGQYYGYTLKLVQSGLLILIWGENENNVAAFYCDKGKFTQISDNIPGLSSGNHFVSVPQCAGETFKVCYLHTLPEERDIAIASWKEIVKNLEGHEWQQITLWKGPYSLHWKDAVPLLEDFRREQGGWLDFLATWSDYEKILDKGESKLWEDFIKRRMEERAERCGLPEDKPLRWIAAEDDPLKSKTSVFSGGIPILLHDPVGQIQDCRRAYLLSAHTLNNYCRQHTPLLASGFMAECTLKNLDKQESEQAVSDVEKLKKAFNIGDSMPNAAPASPPIFPDETDLAIEAVAEYQKEVSLWWQSPEGKRWVWDECQKIKADKTYRPKLSRYSPISFLNEGKEAFHIVRKEYKDFNSEFEKYQDEVFTNHRLLCNGLKRITAIWHILLSEKNKYSFRALLTTALRIEQAFVKQIDETSTIPPLLQLRDLIFCRAYANILDVPMLPSWGASKHAGSARELHLSFQTDVRDNLFGNDDDVKFFCDMFHKGRYPTEAAGKLLMGLIPLFSSFNDSQASALLAAAANRIGAEPPQVREMTLLRLICNLCLSGGSVLMQVEKLSHPNYDNWSLLTKMTNAIDALNEHYFANLSTMIPQKIQEINHLIKQAEKLSMEKKSIENVLKEIDIRMKVTQEIIDQYKATNSHSSDVLSYLEETKEELPLRRASNEHDHQRTQGNLSQIRKETLKQSLKLGSYVIMQSTGKFFNCMLNVCNFRNISSAIDTLLDAPDKPENQTLILYNSITIFSAVMSTADSFRKILFSESLHEVIHKTNIIAGLLATGAEMTVLFSKRNPGAALGMGLFGASSTLLPEALALAKMAGGLALSFAVGALGVAVCILGYCIYRANLDTPLVEFLKNCLWNKVRRYRVQNLRNLPTPCLRDVSEYTVWRTAISDTVDSLCLLYSFEPQLRYDKEEDILSISFEAPCGHGPRFDYKVLLSHIKYGFRTVALETNDLIEPPYLEASNGIFNFHARYHIKKRLHEHASQVFVSASMIPPKVRERQLKEENISVSYGDITIHVTIRYRFSSDIDYGTIKKQEALASIIKPSSPPQAS